MNVNQSTCDKPTLLTPLSIGISFLTVFIFDLNIIIGSQYFIKTTLPAQTNNQKISANYPPSLY